VVAFHGWDRIEQSFASWVELDTARQRMVADKYPLPPLEVSDFDEEDVRQVLEVVTSWLVAGDSARGRPALIRLLRETPVVRRDDGLFEEVTRLLARLDEETNPPPFSPLTATQGSRSQEALQRLQLPGAA
jgi:hypothetical protein